MFPSLGTLPSVTPDTCSHTLVIHSIQRNVKQFLEMLGPCLGNGYLFCLRGGSELGWGTSRVGSP